MKNDIFEPRRFGLFARQQLRENWKRYALGLVGLVTVYAWCFWQTHNTKLKLLETKGVLPSNYESTQYYTNDIFYGLTAVLIWLIAAESLGYYAQKSKAMHHILLPVSVLERFAFAIFLALPVACLASYLIYAAFDAYTFGALKVLIPALARPRNLALQESWYSLVVMNLGGAFLFMLGAVTLGRVHFLKTVGLALVVGLLMYWLQSTYLVGALDVYEASAWPTPWVEPVIKVQKQENIGPYSNVKSLYGFWAQVWWAGVVPLLLMLATYFKMKEKQI